MRENRFINAEKLAIIKLHIFLQNIKKRKTCLIIISNPLHHPPYIQDCSDLIGLTCYPYYPDMRDYLDS